VFAYSAALLWGALASEPPDGLCVLHSGAGSNGLKARRSFPARARRARRCPIVSQQLVNGQLVNGLQRHAWMRCASSAEQLKR